jgi:hypothetical protein
MSQYETAEVLSPFEIYADSPAAAVIDDYYPKPHSFCCFIIRSIKRKSGS